MKFASIARASGLAALVLLLGATAATAQTDVTTARIAGTVAGTDGAPLPGVTVESRNLETGAVTTAFTDERGFYRLLNLPIGNYSVTATLEGFQPAAVDSLRLQLGASPTVNFTLQSAKVSETITVTTETPLVEVTKTSNSTLFETESIERLPQFTRDLKQLATLAPQASIEGERRNLALSGQRGINTNVTIDGVDYNNAFFGGTVGTAEGRAPLSISQESIKEFTVVTNGASVEFGRSGGGFVNVITKSGTNKLRGSVFGFYQPQSLIANFPTGQEPADQQRKQYGGSIGGPIQHDKLFYFLSYDKQDKGVTVPIDAKVLDPQVFAQYPQLASGPTYEQTENGDVLFGRVDYQATPQHRFLLRGNFTSYDGANGTSNQTSRADTYNGNEGLDTDTWVASWSGTFGSSMINDLNINYVNEDTPRQDKGLDLPAFRVTGLGDYGEVDFLPITSTAKRKAFADTFSYSWGAHTFKAGGEYNDTSIQQIFKGNWRGIFRFNNRADFLAGKWSQYNQFGGLGGLTADQAGAADFGQKETALFLQDQWFYGPNLTMSLGLRFEGLDNPNDPILNQNDLNADGSYRLTAKIPDASLTDQISPRFGLSWTPNGDQKMAVRFAIGRYWSRTPGILWAQLFTSNGLRGTQYTINAPKDPVTGALLPPTDPLSPGWGPTFTVPGTERIDFTKVPNPKTPGVFAVDPNFENPYTDRVTLNVEREVMPYTVASLDLTYAKGHQLQRLTDINLQYDGNTGANGLPTYSKTRPNAYYGRVTTSVSDAESKYKSASLSLRRRLQNNYQYGVQVSYSKDEDNDSNERNFSGIQAEDVNNLGLNWGPSNRDQRWRIAMAGLWETPWWGINLSGAFRYATGITWNVIAGSDVNNDGFNTTDRPTINGSHVGRNSENQPATAQLDLRVAKTFELKQVDVSLFAECFNCTDRANWVVPINNQSWGNPNLPAPTTVTYGKENGVNTFIPPRTIQFGFRIDFD